MTPEMPAVLRRLLYFGTLMLLSVYYLNYGGDFDEGEVADSGKTLLPRLAAVGIICLALTPIRAPLSAPVALVVFYLLAGCSYLLGIGVAGGANDTLFLNTMAQTPILFMLASTKWRVDYPRWLRFIGWVLALQVAVDVFLWRAGHSLWLSKAFIGGMGNASSFGLACALLFAFNLLSQRAGRYRLLLATVMAVGAAMSQSLFAVGAIFVAYVLWATLRITRTLINVALVAIGLAFAAPFAVGLWEADAARFIAHKVQAALALVGLVAYYEESRTVSMRVEMHSQTYNAVADSAPALLLGHAGGHAYWPMDSQLLTYMGSFGVPMLVAFLLLHILWMSMAVQNRRSDGGFAAVALIIFALIFLTNRVLDYFPVATLYFLCVAMAHRYRANQ